MSTTINKFPFFDLLEVIPERDLSYKNYQALRPVKTGNTVPGLKFNAGYNHWQNFYNGAPTQGPVAVRQLLSKPLVISFYSKYWQDAGVEQLKQLNALQYEIRANGGNLVIVTPEEGDEQLAKLAWDNSLSLNFYYDENNELSQKFRIYSENDPTWNKFSGIDVNVPLLTTYVINTEKQVIHHYINYDLSNTLIGDDIIAAVYQSALEHTHRRSA